ncbi:hypothetical protein C0Q70_01891 [Pomacea canaliculata]|uniref:Mannosyltransferase n=1 Tax=Pomacea canaliculata TaxID=400727 RepID=A0A2T7Q0R7_POMCA|nr:hypothetical protein C0Q70_01891 [Pomacea canaliculata]
MVIHLVICPYTKVEESFNLQAMHDILNHGASIQQYDHLEFPGVVPRTFLGPLVISLTTYPAAFLARLLSLNKFVQQYLGFEGLGFYVASAFLGFCRAVRLRFGASVMRWLIVLMLTQFHFMFYLSRPLPNIFALALVLVALTYWLHQRYSLFVWTAGAAAIIFRFETVILLGLVCARRTSSGKISTSLRIIEYHIFHKWLNVHSLTAGLTVLVDSYFWQRWLWPEGEVLWFNVFLNKSSEWGTSPFLWYFYSALPRALLGAILLLFWSFIASKSALTFSLPAIIYIFLYSFLPHKELRFIIYTFPVLNTAAACGAHSIWRNQGKSVLYRLAGFALLGLLALNAAVSGLFLYVSYLNYPGGVAMASLHKLEGHRDDLNVHIDVYTAQTGVSRFTQLKDTWSYNKTEDLTPGGKDMMTFTHLMIGVLSDNHSELSPYSTTHKVLTTTFSYSGMGFSWTTFPFIHVRTKETLWILKRITDES